MTLDTLSRALYSQLAKKYGAPVELEVALTNPMAGNQQFMVEPALPLEDRHKEHAHLWKRASREVTGFGDRAETVVTWVCQRCRLAEQRIS